MKVSMPRPRTRSVLCCALMLWGAFHGAMAQSTAEVRAVQDLLSNGQAAQALQRLEAQDARTPASDITAAGSTGTAAELRFLRGVALMDLRRDADGMVDLDFNYAYNPLCDYNPDAFNCTLPPRGNTLDFAVEAGEKLFAGDH